MEISPIRREQVESVLKSVQSKQRLCANRIAGLEDPSSYYSRLGLSTEDEQEYYIRLARLIARCISRLGQDPVEFLSAEGSLFSRIPSQLEATEILRLEPTPMPDLSSPIPELDSIPDQAGPVISDETIDFLFPQLEE